MGSYLIGIDSGTQSTKTIIVDAETGEVKGSSTFAYDLIEGLPQGHKEQHPSEWITALEQTIPDAIKRSGVNPREIIAIGVSGQQHGFVPLDENDHVIRPAKLWCDTSTTEQCDYLIKKLGGIKKTIATLGNSIPPGFTASKILWLKQKEPKNYAKLRMVLLPHDYLNFWLTGNKTMEFGDASGTALMDVRKKAWSLKVINLIDKNLIQKLPKLQSSHLPSGKIRPELAGRFGLSEEVIVSAGGGDNMMGAIGTGNVKPGVVTASFGTSGTIYTASKTPIIDPQGEIAAFCDSTGQWLPLLCTMNLTGVTELVRELFNWDHEQLGNAVAKTPPLADGLLLLPYLEGERTPNVPKGTGVFTGLNAKTFTQGHMARAVMEGVTMGMNYGLNRLRSLGIKPRQIRVTGGGSKSAVWRQIMADIFNAEVVCTTTAEGAAFGAAVQALWCHELQQGRKAKIEAIAEKLVKLDPSTSVKPDPKRAKLYQQHQARQDSLSSLLRSWF